LPPPATVPRAAAATTPGRHCITPGGRGQPDDLNWGQAWTWGQVNGAPPPCNSPVPIVARPHCRDYGSGGILRWAFGARLVAVMIRNVTAERSRVITIITATVVWMHRGSRAHRNHAGRWVRNRNGLAGPSPPTRRSKLPKTSKRRSRDR